MTWMAFRKYAPFSLLALFLVMQLTPVSVHAWEFTSDVLLPVDFPTGAAPVEIPSRTDLDADGLPETLSLDGGHLAILSGAVTAWESPAGWQVVQAAFSDLDRNGTPEVTMLVWRFFQSWPVDEFLPYGGRIAGFHDGQGNSCHLILVGWIHGGFGEPWAGSAMADPVTAFAAADLDGDARQELVTLDGRYARRMSTPAQKLTVWAWNGFGFTIVSAVEGSFTSLALAREENGSTLILTP